jgi:hypothetical protein
MSAAFIPEGHTENRNTIQASISECVIYPDCAVRQSTWVLTTHELLRRLGDRGIKNADVARALNVTPSRVTEMYKGGRAIKLDEAAKLVQAFGLEEEPSPRVAPVPPQIAQLIVQYVAAELGVDLEQNAALIAELSEDVRAFAEFVTDPRVRESIDAATAFFQAMRLRRPAPATTS